MTNGFTPLTPVTGFSEDQLFQDDIGSLLQQLGLSRVWCG